jgi:hypothetical protein
LNGQQFDQEYVSAMKAEHAHDVSCFQDKAAVAQNRELKQWAQQTLPKLQEHHSMAMAAASQVGLPSGGAATALGQQIDDAARTAGQRLDGQNSGTSSDLGRAGSSGTNGSGLNSGSSSGTGTSSGSRDTSTGGPSSGASGSNAGGGVSGSSSGADTGGSSSR